MKNADISISEWYQSQDYSYWYGCIFCCVEEETTLVKGKPVVIGQDPRQSGGRGVVSTCNYEARKYGIHSAMSSKEALELCPKAIFISGNYEKYREVGEQVREIFKRYTDVIEPMSIDEPI